MPRPRPVQRANTSRARRAPTSAVLFLCAERIDSLTTALSPTARPRDRYQAPDTPGDLLERL